MKHTKNLLKSVVSMGILATMLVSGLGTQKSFAQPKSTYSYGVNCNAYEVFGDLYSKALKNYYKAIDAPYKAMVETAYNLTDNLRYEFAGEALLKVVNNQGFLKRNYHECEAYSEGEYGFMVGNARMEKALQYWDEKGATIALYYRNAGDAKPSFFSYRYEKKKNPDMGGFFFYDMRGKIVDMWTFDGFWNPRNSSAYYADTYRCKDLVAFADSLIDRELCQYAGPTIVKIANNSAFLKRNYTREIQYSTDEIWYEANGEKMYKAVLYWGEGGALISLYYKNENDLKPTYVVYRYEKPENPDEIILATYDMKGKLIEYWAPNGYGNWFVGNQVLE
ncbi:MAG: hypothetical protein J5717_00610 [Lachnospiraceae bacterium]|nr:hypothetical protein [Lachnospiraceae bacterium]